MQIQFDDISDAPPSYQDKRGSILPLFPPPPPPPPLPQQQTKLAEARTDTQTDGRHAITTEIKLLNSAMSFASWVSSEWPASPHSHRFISCLTVSDFKHSLISSEMTS